MSLAVVSRDVLREPTRRRVDLREIVEGLHRRHRHAGRDLLAEQLLELLDEDRAVLRAAARFVVEKLLSGLEGRERQRHAASAPERAKREQADRVAVRQLVGKVKIAVLDMMVGDKQLRFLTGSEVARLGAGFVRLAERVPADAYVGEVVTEAEAKALLGDAVKV